MCESDINSMWSSLFGAVVGGGIAFITAWVFFHKANRHAANSKFRSAFIDELHLLSQGEIDVHKILDQSAFERHERAKIEFELLLTEKEKGSFINVWSEYKKYVLWFWNQKVAPGSIDVRDKESKKAVGLIKSILEFTK